MGKRVSPSVFFLGLASTLESRDASLFLFPGSSLLSPVFFLPLFLRRSFGMVIPHRTTFASLPETSLRDVSSPLLLQFRSPLCEGPSLFLSSTIVVILSTGPLRFFSFNGAVPRETSGICFPYFFAFQLNFPFFFLPHCPDFPRPPVLYPPRSCGLE